MVQTGIPVAVVVIVRDRAVWTYLDLFMSVNVHFSPQKEIKWKDIYVRFVERLSVAIAMGINRV